MLFLPGTAVLAALRPYVSPVVPAPAPPAPAAVCSAAVPSSPAGVPPPPAIPVPSAPSFGPPAESPLSPLAPPPSLRPLSKGIKRTPSAGILSALAVAESMARADSSTNASTSPSAQSASGGGGGGAPAAPPPQAPPPEPAVTTTFQMAAVPEPELATAFTVAVTPEPEVTTSFSVAAAAAPRFDSVGAGTTDQEAFDAIAAGADALDSFSVGGEAPQPWGTAPPPALPATASPASAAPVFGQSADVDAFDAALGGALAPGAWEVPAEQHAWGAPAEAVAPQPWEVPQEAPPQALQEAPPLPYAEPQACEAAPAAGAQGWEPAPSTEPQSWEAPPAAEVPSWEAPPAPEAQTWEATPPTQSQGWEPAGEVQGWEAAAPGEALAWGPEPAADFQSWEAAAPAENTASQGWEAPAAEAPEAQPWAAETAAPAPAWEEAPVAPAEPEPAVPDATVAWEAPPAPAYSNAADADEFDAALAGTAAPEPEQPEAQQAPAVEEPQPPHEPDSTATDAAMEATQAGGTAPAAEALAPRATWYGPDGHCYYLSEDGWRYWWDGVAQQWQAHEYVGAAPAGAPEPVEAKAEGVEAAELPGAAGEQQQVEAPAVLEQQRQEASAPSPAGEPSLALPPQEWGQPNGAASEFEAAVAAAVDQGHYGEGQQGPAAAEPQAPPPVTFLPHQPRAAGAAALTPPHQHHQIQAAATFVPALHPSPYEQPASVAAPAAAAPAAWAPSPPQQFVPYQQPHVQRQHAQHAYHQPAAFQQHAAHGAQPPPRPACGFAKLTFGGRLLMVSPSGKITTHLMTALPPEVLRPAATGAPTVSLGGRLAMLAGFPGPLGTSLPREKAAAFFAARKEACVSEEPGSNAAALHALWGVLEAAALHPREAASPRGGPEPGEAAILAALRSSAPAPGPAGAGAGAPANPAALAAVQGLLLSGDRAGALRAALDAHAWPLALILARSAGPAEWQGAVEAFARAALAPGAPLTTACLLTGGAGAAAVAGAALEGWQHHAAAVVASKAPGAEAALDALGGALLAAGRVPEAHACFVLAGAPLQPSDAPGRAFAVVGASRGAAPRTFASLPAILRTEVYTWSRTVGNTGAVPQYAWVLPYKLLHAAALAEAGMLAPAAAYCASVLGALQGLGPKASPGLAVCRAATMDLHERIQALAAARKVSLAGGAFSAGAIVTSVGKLLDRGISALMGGGGDKTGPHSRSSSFAEPGHSRRGSVTALPLPPGSPPAAAAAAAARAPSPTRDPYAQQQQQQHQQQQQQPKLLSNLMSRVVSLTSVVAPPSAPAPAEPLEQENTFYYDNDLKIWRERGVDPPPAAAEPPPPPPMVPAAAVQAVGGGGGAGAGVSRYAMTPAMGGAMAAAPPSPNRLIPGGGFMPAASPGVFVPGHHPQQQPRAPAAAFVPQQQQYQPPQHAQHAQQHPPQQFYPAHAYGAPPAAAPPDEMTEVEL